MKGYEAPTYGDLIAEAYDDLYVDVSEAQLDVLEKLAGDGAALELGVGTGRVALPLAERGVEVHGVDASEDMLDRLRAKPGGEFVRATVSDFRIIEPDGPFSLVYVVFNTFFSLTSQEDQLACFASVADHLEPGGSFLIEAFYPDLSRFDRGQTVRATSVGLDAVQLEVTQHDPVRQLITNQHVVLSREGTRMYPVVLRYAWPSELDLMALAAGLRLRERWGDWDERPFTSGSGRHITLYSNDEDH
ncbi:MAG: methyltransferase domain-containing protein [Candidatus Eisenbacteria bacterium]|nr:methyltransferase domain-containing protein [Candidatus Eisenbacteria bacterium]